MATRKDKNVWQIHVSLKKQQKHFCFISEENNDNNIFWMKKLRGIGIMNNVVGKMLSDKQNC